MLGLPNSFPAAFRRPGSMLLTLSTIAQIEKAIPGQGTLDEKLRKMVTMVSSCHFSL